MGDLSTQSMKLLEFCEEDEPESQVVIPKQLSCLFFFGIRGRRGHGGSRGLTQVPSNLFLKQVLSLV